jgi:nicotinamide-nucleotide amidase
MQDLLPLAEKLGARLKARGDTIGIAESSTGGLISAALLSVGGASAYFRGGSVIYTHSKLGSTWGLSETGATGPTGNRYGDAAGHTCIGLEGPSFSRAITLETGSADRVANMRAFARRAMELLAEAIG